MVRRAAVLLFLIAVAAGVPIAASAAIANAAELTSSLPPLVIQDAEVQRRLAGGLTTTFMVVLRNDGNIAGASRIEVRYDLWDEVYLVKKMTSTAGSSGSGSPRATPSSAGGVRRRCASRRRCPPILRSTSS